jgi:hypothetical protein
MPFVFTWTIPNKQIEFSCVAEDIGEARNKAIDVIKKMEDISYETAYLTEKRTKMIKEIHSAPDDEEEKSACSPPSKNILRKRIFEITKQIEGLRSLVDANIYIGITSLTDFKYTSSGNDEMSLVQLIIRTEPTINEFHPITIKRMNVGF